MTSAAETKKPPVAPKPKFVVANNKPAPPPIAPKPDIVISSVPQSTKKTKPAIAPKPKVLKGSPVRDIGQSPSRKIIVNLEEHKQELPENADNSNCKNVGHQSNDYILPVCSCSSQCIHKLGNRENLCVKQLILEPLEMHENLENSKIDEFSSAIKTRSKGDCNVENVKSQSGVVLKANILEEKLKDVLTQRTLPFISLQKHRSTDNSEINDGCNSNRQFRIEFADLSPSPSSFEKVPDHHHCHLQLPSDETYQHSSEKSDTCFHSSEQEALENGKRSTFLSSDGINKKSEVKDLGPLEIHLVPYSPKFPTPKPRKTRAARLLRQKYIDVPSESTEKPENLDSNSSCLLEAGLKNNKFSVLHQNVLCNQEQVDKVKPGNKSELKVDSNGDRQNLVNPQKAMCHETSSFEKMETDSNLSSDSKTVDGSSMALAVDKGTSFIRCSTLSMSLPKQLKLTCNEHLPTTCNLGVSAPQMQKESTIKGESSSRIVPKKPQRHSLPAAGVLKKAASEELVEKSSYPSNEDNNSEKGLERNHLRHLCAQNLSISSSFDMPKRASEKPVWKLPHPILPFSGNPESLKSVTISSNSELSTAITKPRAKSLSAMDAERCTKPCKDTQKKNSLKKLLNMKLSICFMKSDFQKFWSKNSQLGDTTAGSLSGGERKGIESDWHGMLVEEKTSKPIKAYSADNYSLESQKKRKKSRGQTSAANGPRAESLDDQMLSRDTSSQVSCKSITSGCAPEYENVRHYEEIPEYENLPFIMAIGKTPELEWQSSRSVEDTDANVYEVEEPYEAPDGQVQLGPRHQHSSSGASQEGHNDLGLSELPSDEEEDINTSDEDDVSSDSSKGDPDLGDKQDEDTGMKSKVHHIAKEIMSSEKVFVDVLKLLHIDFRDAVAHASRHLGKPVIEDRILNQILYYLPQLYELNRDLLKELEERMSNWTEQHRIADIFVKKGPYLKMYSTYIKEFDKNIALLDEQCKKNPAFAAVVRDFEMSPRCANLALKHYLLKPVQRIPQYRLLLTDYLKNLLEDSGDYRDTQDALAVVIEVANHANDTMKQGDNFQKLMQIQYSLNGHHEIVQPGRVFLKEGTLMKLSRKVMQPRVFFLFNDALLYTTPVQSGMYKLNNMLSLAGMKVRKPTQEAYQNELKIESVERSFILSASSAAERDEWLEAISRSIEEYAKKRITFCPSRSLEEADSENKEEVSPLGSKAPIWIPDTRATMCMICTSEFTLTWRRHHCRACGKIVCQACSSNKYGLDYLKNQPARVCEHCFQELQKLDHQHSPKIGSPGNHKSPSSALSSVLHSIPSGRKQKKIPAALKEVSANTEDSSMSGYLYRSKGNKKPWKHLWFVIKNKVLYTYAASEDVAALESQPLLGFTVTQVKDENSESRVFQLLHKNMLFYVFKADDAHSAQKWIEAFQEGTIL
ncbi:FYVE, RhoGEF and PH domain-containing protein 6 isoform X2 [Callorhinus ursinus]|uniref:FYVE, RhoGEF and PH domain-containing protein 6 n=1 Tax=Callorhinus ursinus TaxID=34884 RepID=A0A3Q7Q4E1_CALUR|nr:FYVE, RhoGEF and PH domain-containing protein 6 [Callorhinus ursinus]XP_025738200.1 FYVE, RhoGEF and PH domain-containing protein 6 [Callorhinus ursinus]